MNGHVTTVSWQTYPCAVGNSYFTAIIIIMPAVIPRKHHRQHGKINWPVKCILSMLQEVQKYHWKRPTKCLPVI